MGSTADDRNTLISLGLFDGARLQVLVRIRDGNQKEVLADFYSASNIPAFEVQVFNNFGDNYAVIAFADGYMQAGFYPVKVSPGQAQHVDLMLLPKDGRLNFRGAQWAVLAQSHPALIALLPHRAARLPKIGMNS